MKKSSEMLDEVIDTLKNLKDATDDRKRSSSEILEALAAFVDNGLDGIINDINDAKDVAVEREDDLEKAYERIEELEEE